MDSPCDFTGLSNYGRICSQAVEKWYALPALGRMAERSSMREKLKRRKLLEMAQNPQCQVPALLGDGWW